MFIVQIETENSMFDDNPTQEVIRILQEIIESLEQGHQHKVLYDLNGNSVGHFKLT